MNDRLQLESDLQSAIHNDLSKGVFTHVIECRKRNFAGIDDLLAVLRGQMTPDEAEERYLAFKETADYIDCTAFTVTQNSDGTCTMTADFIQGDFANINSAS